MQSGIINSLHLLVGIRFVFFSLVLGFTAFRQVPLTARMAVGVSLVVFFVPTTSCGAGQPELLCGLMSLENAITADGSLLWSAIFAEMLLGVFTGLVIGASAYGVMLSARWISEMLHTSCLKQKDPMVSGTLYVFYVLVFLFIFFSVQGLERTVGVLSQTVFFNPFFSLELTDASRMSTVLLDAFIATGRYSLLAGFLLTLPYFCASLLADFVIVVSSRYYRLQSLSAPVRISLLLFFLSVSFLWWSADNAKVIGFSWQQEKLRSVATAITN